jgi:tripartite-type tricarboxylate transporter receptor subunit TctC
LARAPGRQRLPAAPAIPTVAENALAGFEATTWFGLFAPAGTAAGIVRKINSEVAKILADPEFQRTFLAPQVFEPMASSPEAFAVYIRQESQKWGELIRARNLTIAK